MFTSKKDQYKIIKEPCNETIPFLKIFNKIKQRIN